MTYEFDQHSFEDAMLHKKKEDAVKAALLLIANSEEGGQLTIHNEIKGFLHTEENCGCMPDVYVVPPKRAVKPIH